MLPSRRSRRSTGLSFWPEKAGFDGLLLSSQPQQDAYVSKLRMYRATAVLLLAGSLLISAAGATAAAGVAPRVAGIEAQTTAPYGFDQVSDHCSASVTARDTTVAYSGEASLLVHTANDPECGGPYARGIFHANGAEHLVAGDDFWFGAAIYLPIGFYAAHTSYTDLLRVDSYVNDESESTPYADRAEINFASWNDDDLYVRAARGSTDVSLIGPIAPAQLPEGTWSWVEVHIDLSPTSGVARTELKIDGHLIGSSARANLFVGAEPLNRLRYGIVSTGTGGSGALTAFFDRASIGSSERGPLGTASRSPMLLDANSGIAVARRAGLNVGAGAFVKGIALPNPFYRVGRWHPARSRTSLRRLRRARTPGKQAMRHRSRGVGLNRARPARGG
jgi:hypothetical protein